MDGPVLLLLRSEIFFLFFLFSGNFQRAAGAHGRRIRPCLINVLLYLHMLSVVHGCLLLLSSLLSRMNHYVAICPIVYHSPFEVRKTFGSCIC